MITFYYMFIWFWIATWEQNIGKLAFSKIHIPTILVTERFSWIPQIIDNQECGKYFPPPFQTLLCVGCTVANLAYRR